MRITGRDYTDEDLIAPWDPARRWPRRNGRRDDPYIDDDRDKLDYDDTKPPANEANGEAKP